MKNTKKLNMLTILTAGILMSSFMLANSNPIFAKKSHCDKNDTVCKMTAKNIKNGNSKGNKVRCTKVQMAPKVQMVLMVYR